MAGALPDCTAFAGMGQDSLGPHSGDFSAAGGPARTDPSTSLEFGRQPEAHSMILEALSRPPQNWGDFLDDGVPGGVCGLAPCSPPFLEGSGPGAIGHGEAFRQGAVFSPVGPGGLDDWRLAMMRSAPT